MEFRLTDTHIATFRRDGAVCLPHAVAAPWVERLAKGVEHNLAHPGTMAQHYTDAGGSGAYFGDNCNWRRIPDFAAFVFQSTMADYRLLSWALEPGDAIASHFKTVHDAPANSAGTHPRAVAFRWLGDDARCAQRPGTPSPPYPDMGIDPPPGERLREDWFPTIWPPGRHKDAKKH